MDVQVWGTDLSTQNVLFHHLQLRFDSSLRLPDKDVKAVQDYAYAEAHPFEDVDETAISAEAGLLGQAEQPQDGEQEPIFNDVGAGRGRSSSKACFKGPVYECGRASDPRLC